MSETALQLRQSFPINGTTLFGEPRPLSPSKRVRYLQRKAREREARGRAKARDRSYESETEGRAAGSGGRRAKLERNNVSFISKWPSLLLTRRKQHCCSPPMAPRDQVLPHFPSLKTRGLITHGQCTNPQPHQSWLTVRADRHALAPLPTTPPPHL